MDHEVIGIYYLAACPQVYCVLNIYLTLFCEVTWNLSHQDLHTITTATVLKSVRYWEKVFSFDRTQYTCRQKS